MKRFLFPVAALLLLAACQDSSPLTLPESGAFRASGASAASGANPHFSFLSPLSKTSGGSGVFNPHLAPVATVCEQVGSDCVERARWTLSGGSGGERLRVSLEDEHYHVNWHPRAFATATGVTYRVRVTIGTARLGEIGVAFAANQKDAKQVEAQGLVALPQARTVPVKFRIEQGAVAFANGFDPCEVDCVEATVQPATEDTITTPSRDAGIHLSSAAIPEADGPVTIVISRILLQPGETCLVGTDLDQREKCYRFVADREIQFQPNTVVVGVCLDAPQSAMESYELYKQEETNGQPTGPVQPLEQRDAPFLDCGGSTALETSRNPLLRLAGAGLKLVRPAIGALAPTPLHALDGGMGCDPGSSSMDSGFSRFGWVRPVTIEKVTGDLQSAPPGSTLPLQPTVLVRDEHTGDPASGVAVSFKFIGTSTSPTVMIHNTTTNASGLASVAWTLGYDVGTYSLVVTAPGTNVYQSSTSAKPVPTATFSAVATNSAMLVSHWTADGTTADAQQSQSAAGIDVTGTFGFSTDAMGGSASFSFPAFSTDPGGIVATANGLGTAAISMAAWIKLDPNIGYCSTNQFLEIVGVGEFRYDSCSNEPYRIHYFGGSAPALSVQNVLTSTSCWYHVAVVDGPTSRTMYVNGAAIQSLPRTGQLTPTGIKISDSSSEAWEGLIDEVKIWNGALTAAEVASQYQAGDPNKRCSNAQLR